MKNVLISIGGNCNSNISNKNLNFEQIIAVDSGIKHIYNLSLEPNILVGDLDSISKEDYQKVLDTNINIESYQENKEHTDFELSLNKIENPHDKNIFIIGGEGGDIDHMLSIFAKIMLEKGDLLLTRHQVNPCLQMKSPMFKWASSIISYFIVLS